VLFAWFGDTLWPWLERVGVYYLSVLVLLSVGVLAFKGITSRALGTFLATGFWFALARGLFLVFAQSTGLDDWYLEQSLWLLVPAVIVGNTLLVIILDGAIRGFWVRSWYTAGSLGVLLSFTDVVGHLLFVPKGSQLFGSPVWLPFVQ
jgi:hypothetical protein